MLWQWGSELENKNIKANWVERLSMNRINELKILSPVTIWTASPYICMRHTLLFHGSGAEIIIMIDSTSDQ